MRCHAYGSAKRGQRLHAKTCHFFGHNTHGSPLPFIPSCMGDGHLWTCGDLNWLVGSALRSYCELQLKVTSDGNSHMTHKLLWSALPSYLNLPYEVCDTSCTKALGTLPTYGEQCNAARDPSKGGFQREGAKRCKRARLGQDYVNEKKF